MANELYNVIGADLSASTTTEDFKPGEVARAGHGSEYVFCRLDTSGTAVAASDVVIIDENYVMDIMGTGALSTGDMVGVATHAFATGEYGWIQIKGTNVNVNAVNKPAANTTLSNSGTAGNVDTSGTTNLDGIVLVAQPTTTAADTAVEAILNHPTVA